METFLLAFIPLFVAIDPAGTIPLFIGLTEGVPPGQKVRLAVHAVITAFVTALVFCGAGHMIFLALGISSADFKIAGGILLLIFSIREIFGKASHRLAEGEPIEPYIGIVPLGIPLIAGPAMITTILILHDTYGFVMTMTSATVNLIITLVFLVFADRIGRLTGTAFLKVTGKVVAIFLAAIGVMMIRKGIQGLL